MPTSSHRSWGTPLTAIALIVAVCIAAFLAYHHLHPTKASALPEPPHGYKWANIFSDEFASQSIDGSKWVTCYDWYDQAHNGCSNNGNHELEWYTPQQVSMANGELAFQAIHSTTLGKNGSSEQPYPYQSGMISTGRASWSSQPKWTGTYGYYEARMYLPAGKGVWPAFWLLPADHSWPPEIDIMEMLGDKPNGILMTYHWAAGGIGAKDESIYMGSDFSNGWHTYGINWQPGKLDWYTDGVKRKSVTSKNVPSKPMEMILNLAVGGDLPGNPNASTPFPAEMKVDYVHVYSLQKSQ